MEQVNDTGHLLEPTGLLFAGDGGARGSIETGPGRPAHHPPQNPRFQTPPEDVRWEWHPVRKEWIGWTTETCLFCNSLFDWEGILPVVCGMCLKRINEEGKPWMPGEIAHEARQKRRRKKQKFDALKEGIV